MNNPETLLAEKGFYWAAVHGKSMEPLLLNHRDTAFIEPRDTYQKRDVVLFRRRNGQLVLHRLLRCDGERFIACGDNDFRPEEIALTQILGVMTAFTRNGRDVSVSSRGYRLYSLVWNASMPTKRVLQCLYQLWRKLR